MKEKSKRPLYIALSTQKGGVGKTTLTVLMASYLHYLKGMCIAVVDCDYPQHSIVGQRRRDEYLLEHNETYRRLTYLLYSRQHKVAYTVMESTPAQALEDALELTDTEDTVPDIIFFDMPGSVSADGVFNTLAGMDYILTPMSADNYILESTIAFAKNVKDHVVDRKKGRVRDIILFWNKVHHREKTELYALYEPVIRDLGLTLMDCRLPDSVRFHKECIIAGRRIFRSTLLPPDMESLERSGLDRLCDELAERIKLHGYGKER